MEPLRASYIEEKLTLDDLLEFIPTDWEYTITIQRRSYRYFAYLKVFNRKKAFKLNGSSNELSTVIRSMIEKLKDEGLGGLRGNR